MLDARAAADAASAALIALDIAEEIEPRLIHSNRDTDTWKVGRLGIVVDHECRIAAVYCQTEGGLKVIQAGVPDGVQRAKQRWKDERR